MIAKELQIGDWVRIKGNPCKVSYLAPFDIGDARLAIICNDYDGNPYLDGFEPISLTEEILEKNGFDVNSSKGEWSPCIEGFTFDNSYSDELMWNKIEINYVHELQHALRLCGLNDLADNIQV